MKVHTLMKYVESIPMVVDLTATAKHDHYLLKEVHLPKDSTEDLREIYRRHWAIETLYRQLKTELSTAFLLRRQRQRYSNTNPGGAYCQFALHGHGTKDKTELYFLTNRNNANVLQVSSSHSNEVCY